MRRVEGREQGARLLDGNLRRLAFDGGVALAPDGEGRVEHDGVTHDHSVEEMPQGGEMLIACGDAGGFGEALEVFADMPGSDLGQLAPTVLLGPLEEELHRVPVGTFGVLVANRTGEKLLCRENSVRASAVDDVGQLV